MGDKLFSLFSHDLAIDLGTANTLVFVRGQGIVIREPSVVAIDRKSREILAVGSEAKKMLGKTPASILAIRPLRSGVISDFEMARGMLTFFIQTVHHRSLLVPFLPRPVVVLGIPSGVTPVERRAVTDAAEGAGARRAYLIEEPMAAAIGAGLAVEEPEGLMVVDIGGGTCEIAVISLGGVVVNKSLRVAGDEMDQEIINYAKFTHNILLGERSAEEIKISVGSAFSFDKEEEVRGFFRGRDLSSGLPKTVEISALELREALKAPIKIIVEAIKDTLEETPPELVSDILRNGITLAGGAAQLTGFDQLIAKETGMPTRLAKDPMTCVVRGCAAALDKASLLERVRVS